MMESLRRGLKFPSGVGASSGHAVIYSTTSSRPNSPKMRPTNRLSSPRLQAFIVIQFPNDRAGATVVTQQFGIETGLFARVRVLWQWSSAGCRRHTSSRFFPRSCSKAFTANRQTEEIIAESHLRALSEDRCTLVRRFFPDCSPLPKLWWVTRERAFFLWPGSPSPGLWAQLNF